MINLKDLNPDSKVQHKSPAIQKIEGDNKRSDLIAKEMILINSWLISKQGRTRISYESDIKAFFEFFSYKPLALGEITEAHISVYLEKNNKLKASTLSRKKAAISSLLSYLVKKRYIEKNPVEFLGPIKVADQTQFRVISHDEVVRMLELEDNRRNRAMIRTLYKTGLRIDELLNLKFSSIKQRGESFFLIVVGKGNKSRTVGLDKKTVDELFSFKKEMGTNDDFIFRSQKFDKKLSKKSAWKIIKLAAIKAGLDPSISPHWLRHAHATSALASGADIRLIQKTLGHESINTTAKYAKVFPEMSSSSNIDI